MGKKKYYAVRKGYKTGIFENWEDCKSQTQGFSGAEYKSFPTLDQAEKFLGISNETKNDTTNNIKINSEAVAYVDGSYNDQSKEFSYGVVFFHNDIEKHYVEKFNSTDLVSMRNVAGEIKGAEKAMRLCIEKNITSLDLYYDYEGIEKWCTGSWKATKVGTKAYVSFYSSIQDKLKVNFIKVESHSGDKYNDLADALAKSALGLGDAPSIVHQDNGITANNIKYNDLIAIIDILKEESKNGLTVASDDVPYGKRFELSINDPSKQRLLITHYTDKDKIWITGKKEDLFNAFSSYIIELLEFEEVPVFLNTVFDIKVDTDLVEIEYNKYLPNANRKLPEKMKNYLHQAVYNLQISGNMYNATFLVEPAIRPLEGFLKFVQKNKDIPIRYINDSHDSFFVFEKKNNKYILKNKFVKKDHSKEFLECLCECYTHYHNHRHTLNHWDDSTEPLDTTRVINTPAEAHTLIKDTLKAIDNLCIFI